MIYHELTCKFGEPVDDRAKAPVTPEQEEDLKNLSPRRVRLTDLTAERIRTILTLAPGNGVPIGGCKVAAQSGWLAARPSGSEGIHKIHAASFRIAVHLHRIWEPAQVLVSGVRATEFPSETNRKAKP